eukprot:TRINITY_DN49263_c0_g1_i1.p1 TRINITY_DN49263_c0_g1~~TRINITY_DN49263_c0_g1_i1.p1  ORF type:complete len:363 (+),score=81.78 TRINITY_DN49263_c0_g1_i1:127-1215(+)
MGQKLSFLPAGCDDCAASCDRERCGSMCFAGGRGGDSQVHTTHVVSIDTSNPVPPRPERYAPALGVDAETSWGRCVACEVPRLPDVDRYIIEKTPRLCDMPRGSGVPNVGRRLPIESLTDDCQYNEGKVKKIMLLSQTYGQWRPVRGDGNCFYRAVMFGCLETLLRDRDFVSLRRIVELMKFLTFDVPEEQEAHKEMLERLSAWESPEALEQWIAEDSPTDTALVLACRRLVSAFLCDHADEETANGLTYEALVTALDSSYKTVQDFCKVVVDPMGRDAESIAIDALPQQLGMGLRLWILDRRDENDLASWDIPGPDGLIDIHVLFKPGHYELLYLREDAPAYLRRSQSQLPCGFAGARMSA